MDRGLFGKQFEDNQNLKDSLQIEVRKCLIASIIERNFEKLIVEAIVIFKFSLCVCIGSFCLCMYCYNSLCPCSIIRCMNFLWSSFSQWLLFEILIKKKILTSFIRIRLIVVLIIKTHQRYERVSQYYYVEFLHRLFALCLLLLQLLGCVVHSLFSLN